MNEQNAFMPEQEYDVNRGVDLSQYDQEYQQTEAADFDEVPDGKYQVRIQSVRMAESTNGNPLIKWDLVILNGKFEGRHIFKNSVITPAALPFIKGDLKTLGLQLAKFSDLPLYLETLLDLRLNVTKRTKGDFTNVYFQNLITAAAPANPDETPF